MGRREEGGDALWKPEAGTNTFSRYRRPAIRGFEKLVVKASCETEEQETDGQQYVKRKAGKPLEATLTVSLSAYLGCDVREEAYDFLNDARSGAKDYFYVGSGKLDTCQLMLTDADMEDIEIAPDGTWTSCSVKLILKQCSKNDESSEAASSGDSSDSGGDDGGEDETTSSKKASVKTTSASTAKATTTETAAKTSETSKTSLFQAAMAKGKRDRERCQNIVNQHYECGKQSV